MSDCGVVLPDTLSDTLKEIILDFQEEELETGTRRHLAFEMVEGKAFVCIGVRRCGKSTLLYQIIEDLKQQGVSPENILYINFFDDRLTELKHGRLSLVMEAYYSLFPGKKKIRKRYIVFLMKYRKQKTGSLLWTGSCALKTALFSYPVHQPKCFQPKWPPICAGAPSHGSFFLFRLRSSLIIKA